VPTFIHNYRIISEYGLRVKGAVSDFCETLFIFEINPKKLLCPQNARTHNARVDASLL